MLFTSLSGGQVVIWYGGITVMNYRVNKITSALLIHIKTMPEDKLLFWQQTNNSALIHKGLLSFKYLTSTITTK